MTKEQIKKMMELKKEMEADMPDKIKQSAEGFAGMSRQILDGEVDEELLDAIVKFRELAYEGRLDHLMGWELDEGNYEFFKEASDMLMAIAGLKCLGENVFSKDEVEELPGLIAFANHRFEEMLTTIIDKMAY